MKRQRLQLLTLMIWVVGIMLLETIVVVAHWETVDNRKIDINVDLDFRNRVRANPLSKISEKSIEPLSTVEDLPRTRHAFYQYVYTRIPDADLAAFVTERAATHSVKEFMPKLVGLYLPWLAIMTIGLVSKNTTQEDVIATDRAVVAVMVSTALQLLFIAWLLYVLFIGDIKSNVDSFQMPGAVGTSIIGAVLQLVFGTTKVD